MTFGEDSLPTVVLTAKERDLKPLLEASIEALDLDLRQISAMEDGLHDAWFFGIKTGHKVTVETKLGESDPMPVILSMQDEFQDVMERCAEGLNLTVSGTIAAWNYLGEAWIAGTKFWEVEIAARLIEWQTGGFDEWLRELEG
ncbi:MAG TPA: hypothetical protein VFK14_02515 [Solirubrobacterales bacterium]|nr:hypothetical protein [Solirubrobacterales bacterium]